MSAARKRARRSLATDDVEAEEGGETQQQQQQRASNATGGGEGNPTDDAPMNDDEARAAEAELNEAERGGAGAAEVADGGGGGSVDESGVVAGIIERVELTNFKNHRHLSVQLGAKINFITGTNGSGKSALLHAISVGLGSRGLFSQRGGNLRVLIRTGQNTARIVIHLRNRGVDAYKPELYGKTIIVERTLRRVGATVSQFRVLNGETRKLVSQRAADVNEICDAFNIQIENPCAILMQDTARQFLTTSKPEEKYKFFTDATRIAAAETDYAAAVDSIEQAGINIARQSDMLKDLQAQRDALQRECDAVAHLDELQRKVEMLEEEVMMATVASHELEAKKQLELVESMRAKRDELLRARDDVDRKVAAIEARVQAQQAAVDELTNERAAITARASVVKEELRALRSAATEAEVAAMSQRSALQAAERVLDRKRAARAVLKREADAETMTLDQRQRARAEEQARLDAAVNAARQTHTQLDDELGERRARVQAARAKLGEHDEQLNTRKARLAQAERALRDAQSSATDSLNRFGPDAARLDAELKRELGAHCIGPIGEVVKIRDMRWALAIEECIDRDLSSYVVPDQDTYRRALAIVRRVNPRERPTIIVVRTSAVYDLPAEIRQRPNTILNQLVPAVPALVVNALIDIHSIEASLLFATEDEGNREFFGVQHNFNLVRFAYVASGARLSKTTGQTQVTMRSKRQQATMLGVDASLRIQQAQQAFAALQKEVDQLQAARAPLEAEARAAQQAEDSARRQLDRAETELQQATRAAEQLRSKSEIAERSKADELAELDSDIAAKDAERRDIQTRVRDADDLVAAKNVPCQQLEAQSNAFVAQLRDVGERVAQASALLAPIAAELQAASNAKIKAVKVYEVLERELAPAEAQYRAAFDDAAQQRARVTAMLKYPEQTPSMPLNQLKTKLQALTNKREQQRGEHRNPEVIKQELAVAKLKYTTAKQGVRELHVWQLHMKDSLTRRLRNLHHMKFEMATRINDQFNTMLSQQGHSGSVECDHASKTLDVRVVLKDQLHEDHRTSKTLSGGERMFATVSLLLALWNCMEMPFRALDEFDVFMDAVNRKTSIDLLIRAAREDSERQYIFITPHEVSSIPTLPEVRVIKMRPPDRDQSVLQFPAARV